MVSVATGTLRATTFALLTVLDHAAGSGFGDPEVKGRRCCNGVHCRIFFKGAGSFLM